MDIIEFLRTRAVGLTSLTLYELRSIVCPNDHVYNLFLIRMFHSNCQTIAQ